MSDITLSVKVTRTDTTPPKAELELNDGPYRVAKEGLIPGESTWRRIETQSPFVPGKFLVNAVRDGQQATIVVNVTAATHALLSTAIANLVEAFSQFSYTITVVMDGQTFEWDCDVADYAVGIVQERWAGLNVPVGFQFNRHPIPTQGVV